VLRVLALICTSKRRARSANGGPHEARVFLVAPPHALGVLGYIGAEDSEPPNRFRATAASRSTR
jgi:hypothetical protein